MSVTLAVVAAACLAVAFSRSLRLGRRVRAMRRQPVRVNRAAVSQAAVGALAGYVLAGFPGAAFGLAASGPAAHLTRRSRERTTEAALAAQAPGVARALAAGLRAGLNIPLALEAARDGAPEPIRAVLDHAVVRSTAGLAPDAALGDVAALREVARSLRLGALAAADLPSILDATAESLEERARIQRDRRAATAQGRMSAWIVAAMPLAFYVLAGSGARQAMTLLATEPAGWALLVTGAALELAGLAWMRTLTRIS